MEVKQHGHNDGRVSLDFVLMETAYLYARRGTCDRKGVGCILVKDGRIVSTGYNGPVMGQPHCNHLATGDDKPCYKSVHAESNAVAFAARMGISINDATAYCTLSPCMACAMMLINGGVTRVIYANQYRDGAGIDLLTDSNVEVIHYAYQETPATAYLPNGTNLS